MLKPSDCQMPIAAQRDSAVDGLFSKSLPVEADDSSTTG